jgi:hypothetical protein
MQPTSKTKLEVDPERLIAAYERDPTWQKIQAKIARLQERANEQADRLTLQINQLTSQKSKLCAQRRDLRKTGGPPVRHAQSELFKREQQIINLEMAREVKAYRRQLTSELSEEQKQQKDHHENAQERPDMARPIQDSGGGTNPDHQADRPQESHGGGEAGGDTRD